MTAVSRGRYATTGKRVCFESTVGRPDLWRYLRISCATRNSRMQLCCGVVWRWLELSGWELCTGSKLELG